MRTGLPLQSLAQLRDVAAKWEVQAQDSLAQNERLKDLLEESATWSVPATAAPAGGSNGSSSGSSAAVGADVATAAAAGLAQQTADGAAGQAAAGAAGAQEGAAAAGGADSSSALAALCQRFERELLLEKAKSAQLDMQVRWAGWVGAKRGVAGEGGHERAGRGPGMRAGRSGGQLTRVGQPMSQKGVLLPRCKLGRAQG